LNGWPGAAIILPGTASSHAYYSGPCPLNGGIIIPNYTNAYGTTYVTCTTQTEDGYSGGAFGNTQTLVNRPGGMNFTTYAPSAIVTPAWYEYTPTGLKGVYNLTPNNSTDLWRGSPTDLITLLDCNPFKTLAIPGNRPTWDACDTAIGVDSIYNGVNVGIGGAYLRAPSAISFYIGTFADGHSYNWRDYGTSIQSWPPFYVFNALNVSQITGAPVIGTISTVGSTGTIPANQTNYYIVQGFNDSGHTVWSNEKSVTAGSGPTNANVFYSTFPAGVTSYNWYTSTSTGTEIGPCNATPLVYSGGSAETQDFTGVCTGTAPTNTNTMPAASITLNGGTAWTGSSSANPQVVTCATGGTSTQYCGADGAWHTIGSGMVYPAANTLGLSNSGGTGWTAPTYANIVALWASGSCSGFLKNDGTCSTPSPTPSFPVTVAGTVNSGGIPYFNSATQESSTAALTANVVLAGGGAGNPPAGTSIIDNGTTVATSEPVITTSYVETGVSPPGCSAGTAGYICETTGTGPTGLASTGEIWPNLADNTYYENVNNGTAQHWPQTAFSTGSYTNATTTFSSITGLAFSVAASTNYHMHCNLIWSTGTATGGPKYQITGPATPTAVVIQMESAVTAATSASAAVAAFSTTLNPVGAVVTTSTDEFSTLDMDLVNGSTAGTVQVQAAAQGAGTLTIINGSGCQIQ
jgi:hypothetical protein